MKRYMEFNITGKTYEEREGEPDAFASAIGCLTMQFSNLEDKISEAITSLPGAPGALGDFVISERSFRSKLKVFESLVRECDRAGTRRFNVGNASLEEDFGELLASCLEADELRNSVMRHSLWIAHRRGETPTITKQGPPSQQGSPVAEVQEVDASYLMDIADFMMCLAEDVGQFMYNVDEFERSHPANGVCAPVE